VKAFAALGIVVAGAVGMFAVYTFGWRDSGGEPQADVVVAADGHRIYTIRHGDVIRVPATATECVADQEATFPRLFCMRTGPRARYQVAFWSDSVDLYDLARHGEPMEPTFSVPATR
jgi:hypothetical protein